MAIKIVLLGPPGAGKGTQAIRLSKHLQVPHISTGDMMRESVASGSALGNQLKQYLDSGALVPDEIVLQVVRERLKKSDCSNGFLLDGFPRTLPQGQALRDLLREDGKELSLVVNFVVPDAELIERIVKRGAQSGRSDDTVEVARKRLEVFRQQTEPLVDFYRSIGILKEIQGVGQLDEVFARLAAAVDSSAIAANA